MGEGQHFSVMVSSTNCHCQGPLQRTVNRCGSVSIGGRCCRKAGTLRFLGVRWGCPACLSSFPWPPAPTPHPIPRKPPSAFPDQPSLFQGSEHCSRTPCFFLASLPSTLITRSSGYSLFKQPMPLKSYLSNIFPQHMSKFTVSAFIP